MLKKHIISILKDRLGYQPTSNQEELIDKLSDFVINTKEREIFLVKGYAGTGKTTIVSSLVKTLQKLKQKSILLAPTGRAAKILTFYSNKKAYTIHRKIYRQKSSKDVFGEFVLDKNFHTNTIFIVDEASMIADYSNELSIFGSGRLLDDLLNYVYNDKKCKLILLGDTAQLPPVGLDISPALNKAVLESFGFSVVEMFLTDVIRQSQDSGVLYNATSIRNLINNKNIFFPKFKLKGFTDIKRIDGSDLIENISDAYDKYGIEGTMVVGRSNKRVVKYNQGIRNQILWREEEISIGEYLMVVRNNYYWLQEDESQNIGIDFIANGDIVEIVKIHQYQERYGFRFADVTIRFADYENIEIPVKILLDTLTIETAALTNEENKKFYYSVIKDYEEYRSKRKKYEMVRNNPFFNALQVKYAYAVTCHKAQGGQWEAVFIDQGYVNDDMLNVEYLRWLYTAFTRAIKKLYLVNFRNMFFAEEEL